MQYMCNVFWRKVTSSLIELIVVGGTNTLSVSLSGMACGNNIGFTLGVQICDYFFF